MEYKINATEEDIKKFGYDVIIINGNTHQFMAIIDLRTPEFIKDLWNLEDNQKLIIHRRGGNTSYYKVRTLKSLIDIRQFNNAEEAIKYRCS